MLFESNGYVDDDDFVTSCSHPHCFNFGIGGCVVQAEEQDQLRLGLKSTCLLDLC